MTAATEPTALALRPYQEEAIAAVNEAALDGVTRPLVALPTGTGKTVIFGYLLARRASPALVLAHRDELIRQSVDKLLLVNPDFDVGVVKAEQNEVSAPVVVASVQTLSRPNRLAQLREDFRTVVVDEAHHGVADTYQRILEHVGSLAPGGPLTVGFTATPERGDKVGLNHVWEKIVYRKDLLEMILAGYLCDLRAVRIALKADLDQVHTRAGDFVDRELESVLLNANAPAHVVEAYQEHAAGRKALVFTPTVRLAHEMAEAFRQAGIAAEALDGGTPEEERRGMVKRLQAGGTMVLANCAVLTEGFDSPSVDCIIIARPTKSRPFYVQMIGRGTRIHPGKADCLIIDCVGVSQRHSLVTADSLLGKDLSNGLSVREIVEQEEAAADLLIRPVDGQLVASKVNLFSERPMHWVSTGAGTWVLSLGDGFVRLLPREGDRWDVHHCQYSGGAELIRAGLPLGYAQGVAEDYVRSKGAVGLVWAGAHWREQPATEKQIKWLRWQGILFQPGLTKGEASDLISSYKAMLAEVR
jgi:ATP-dependent helicase IRC3